MGEEKARVIVDRRCDVPMARSKGLLGKCLGRCQECLCCIEKDSNGNEQHVSVVRGGDPGLIARNLSRLLPLTQGQTGNRRIGPFFGGKRI